MKIFNRYIFFIVLASCLVNIVLAFMGQTHIDIYFILNLLAFLVITQLFVFLNPSGRKALGSIGVVLFAGFAIVVIMKIFDYLVKK